MLALLLPRPQHVLRAAQERITGAADGDAHTFGGTFCLPLCPRDDWIKGRITRWVCLERRTVYGYFNTAMAATEDLGIQVCSM